MSKPHCLVIGAGVFGVTGAIELARRGRRVTLIDPGPLPHPDAASTDISKIIRPDYGSDVFYCELMERALAGWRAWNTAFGAPLFHEQGFCVLSSTPLVPGTFEGDSLATLQARGYPVERLDARAILRRFPAWRPETWIDGYVNPRAGWAESGRVVAALLARARDTGVDVRQGATAAHLIEHGGRVLGARLTDGSELHADAVIVAAGAWTPVLVPWLADRLRAVGQPVLHFAPHDPAPFTWPAFTAWAGDIQKTGFYGFPVNRDGVVKLANHGKGQLVDPRAERTPPTHADPAFRAFLGDKLPALADAPIVRRRLCLYCDSKDGDFWIAADPERPGLFVAAGGSGHGFKFAPVLGELIANLVDARPDPAAARFAWRDISEPGHEDARCRE